MLSLPKKGLKCHQLFLQEYDARAALAAEKAAEKEEEKRRQKIAEWENLSSMGMGAGRATGTSTSTPPQPSTSSSRQRSSFRPGKREREITITSLRIPLRRSLTLFYEHSLFCFPLFL